MSSFEFACFVWECYAGLVVGGGYRWFVRGCNGLDFGLVFRIELCWSP